VTSKNAAPYPPTVLFCGADQAWIKCENEGCLSKCEKKLFICQSFLPVGFDVYYL